jgi:hypothetical protein
MTDSLTDSQRAGADFLFPPLQNDRPDFTISSYGNGAKGPFQRDIGGLSDIMKSGDSNLHYQQQPQDQRQQQHQQHQQHQHDDHYNDQVPLFARRNQNSFIENEREERLSHEDNSRLADHLEDALKQLAQVEHINEDLEHRLEQQARRHLQVVKRHNSKLTKTSKERDEAIKDAQKWKDEYNNQVRRTEAGAERLRRVEKELYRMHLKKYNVLQQQQQQQGGNGMKSLGGLSSPFPPGFPVPQNITTTSTVVGAGSSTALGMRNGITSSGNNYKSINGGSGGNIADRKSRIKDEERRAMARMKKSNMPCYVHGRVGCPCSAMAYETNVSEGLDSLASFLGLPMSGDGDDGNGNVRHSTEEVYEERKTNNAFMEYRTPEFRPSSYSNLESPGGLSLPGVV